MATMGRPRKWDDVAAFEEAVELYRLNCEEREVPMTHPGIALWLGFVDKVSFWDYGQHEDFAEPVKKARSMIEQGILEKALKANGAGAIFYLKNMGYTDKHAVSIDPVNIRITGVDAKL